MDIFCKDCGTRLIDGVCPSCLECDEELKKDENAKLKKLFASPNEKVVAILGNSYVQNFIHDRSIRKGFAVVSDKRVYFKGKCYEITNTKNGKRTVAENRKSRVVDLEDVSGTGLDNYSNISPLIVACIILIIAIVMLFSEEVAGIGLFMFLLALLCFFVYLDERKSIVVIQYAGGEIGFDKRWFTEQEVDQFQKQLRLAKDKVQEKNQVAQKQNLQSEKKTNKGVVSEIVILGDMLSRGMITEEEFEQMKKELL